MLGVAVLCSTYFFTTVCGITLERIPAFWRPHEGQVIFPFAPAGVSTLVARDLKLMMAATAVLISLWGIAGKWAAGVAGGQHWKRHRIGLGYFMRSVYPTMMLLLIAQGLTVVFFPGLLPYTSNRSGTLPVWYDSFFSFAAGYTEEIIATVFLYWLLEQVRWRGTTLAATGRGTAIIVFAHWTYHAQYGIVILHVLASVYFTVICWRSTRSLWALVAGHMLWDLTTVLPHPLLSFAAKAVLAAIGFFVLDWPWKKSKTAK